MSGPMGGKNRMTVFFLAAVEETHRLGRLLGRALTGGGVVALRGDLGAGKTCLAQGIGPGAGGA